MAEEVTTTINADIDSLADLIRSLPTPNLGERYNITWGGVDYARQNQSDPPQPMLLYVTRITDDGSEQEFWKIGSMRDSNAPYQSIHAHQVAGVELLNSFNKYGRAAILNNVGQTVPPLRRKD